MSPREKYTLNGGESSSYDIVEYVEQLQVELERLRNLLSEARAEVECYWCADSGAPCGTEGCIRARIDATLAREEGNRGK